MANLTLKIDDDVLRRARIRAVEEGTSVNQVVRDQILAFAGPDEATTAWRDFLTGAHTATASSPQGRDWTRDELHSR